jgi:hypothetical protein
MSGAMLPLATASLPATPLALNLPAGGPMDILVHWAESTPLGLRGVVGTAGAVLLLAGARFYRLALVAPGVLGGALLAWTFTASFDTTARVLLSIVLALVGALVCYYLERLAIRLVGLIIGGMLVNSGWPVVTGLLGQASVSAPWWGLVIGAAVGILLVPLLLKWFLRLVTSLLGAALLSYALGLSDNIWLLGALTLFGFTIQTFDALVSKDGRKDRSRTEG